MGNLKPLNQIRFSFSKDEEVSADIDDIKDWLRDKREEAMSATHAESTLRAYKSMWRIFETFCFMFEYKSMPAQFEAVADFLCAYIQDRASASARNAYSAIRYYHLINGYEFNYAIEIKHLLKGLRRLHGSAPGRKKPIKTDVIKIICAALDERGGVKSIRDKALLLGAYSGALRASEVVGQNLEHLTFDHRGLSILIPRSKTDQEGEGQEVPIPRAMNTERCPVLALEEWRDVLIRMRGGSRSGPLFPVLRAGGDKAFREVHLVDRRMSTNDYRSILKDLCAEAGEDPDEIGGHSLRSGHATQAAENGASPFVIAAQGRWRSLQMVMVYVRLGKRFQNNSVHHLGL